MDPVMYRRLHDIMQHLDAKIEKLQLQREQEAEYQARMADLVDKVNKLAADEKEEQKKLVDMVSQLQTMQRKKSIMENSERLSEKVEKVAKGAKTVAQVVEILANTITLTKSKSKAKENSQRSASSVVKDKIDLSAIIQPLTTVIQSVVNEKLKDQKSTNKLLATPAEKPENSLMPVEPDAAPDAAIENAKDEKDSSIQ